MKTARRWRTGAAPGGITGSGLGVRVRREGGLRSALRGAVAVAVVHARQTQLRWPRYRVTITVVEQPVAAPRREHDRDQPSNGELRGRAMPRIDPSPIDPRSIAIGALVGQLPPVRGAAADALSRVTGLSQRRQPPGIKVPTLSCARSNWLPPPRQRAGAAAPTRAHRPASMSVDLRATEDFARCIAPEIAGAFEVKRSGACDAAVTPSAVVRLPGEGRVALRGDDHEEPEARHRWVDL